MKLAIGIDIYYIIVVLILLFIYKVNAVYIIGIYTKIIIGNDNHFLYKLYTYFDRPLKITIYKNILLDNMHHHPLLIYCT